MSKRNIAQFLGVATAMVSVFGCSRTGFDEDSAQKVLSSQLSNTNSQQASLSLRIEDMSGGLLYSDANFSTAAVVSRNTSVKVCGTASVAGTTFEVRLNNVLRGTGTGSQCLTLNTGTTTGNFPMKITASAPNAVAVTRNYTLAVTCSPAEVIGMTPGQYVTGIAGTGSNSHYSYALSGPNLAGADCSIDFNGDGAADNDFRPCTQAVTAKSNHVGSRTALVYVRERACNHAMPTSLPMNLAWSMPGAGTQHVQGTVASLAIAPGRTTALNLQHLSINEMVRCNYGNGEFTVEGINLYSIRQGQGAHGMKIDFKGLTGTIKAGNVSPAGASMQDYDFATDFASDKNIPITFSGDGTSCQGTITVAPLPVVGVPCDTAASGQVKKYSAQFNGTFGCSNLVGSDDMSRIDVGGGKNARTGTFMCIVAEADACIGGGGGGGGGVPPVEF